MLSVIERGEVYDAGQAERSDDRCCAFPALLQTSDGALLCCFKVGPAKVSSYDRLLLKRSVDGGRTWQLWAQDFPTAYAGVPGSLCAGYLCEPTPGRLLMSQHWIDRRDPSLPLSNPKTGGVLPMKWLLSESGDGGRQWSAPREISLLPHLGTNPTCAIIRLNTGELMQAYESWRPWDASTGAQSANVKFSSDEGANWSAPATLARDPQGQRYYWDNRVTRQPGTGRLLAALWTHDSTVGQDLPLHLAWGSPDGRTWAAPQTTPFAGQVTAPLFLDEQTLLLAYVHRQDPPGLRVAVSRDAGVHWEQPQVEVFACPGQTQAGIGLSRSDAEYWDDMTRWTFGHPNLVQRSEREALLAYYAPPRQPAPGPNDPPATSIHWVRLRWD